MNRKQFMEQLERLLSDISEAERQEALEYYEGYFDDAGPENEGEVIRELGNPGKVAAIRSEEYYVNMARAWYFATALAKKYDQVLPFLEEQKMDVWTHNKTIQKAIESYRITPEQKEYLRILKIRQ